MTPNWDALPALLVEAYKALNTAVEGERELSAQAELAKAAAGDALKEAGLDPAALPGNVVMRIG